MCTAISFAASNFYFGRNLDLEYCYDERVVITPRSFSFGTFGGRCAIIGMAYIKNGYPLYYDAVNEYGLGVAGLNFPGNAFYMQKSDKMQNVAPYEFIPWVLTQCKSVDEAERLLEKTNVWDADFDEELKNTPLHWLIADRNRAIVAEPTKNGLMIYENKAGVLTNNPPFDMQMFNLNNYMTLSANSVKNRLSDKLALQEYSRGMGALGLPGDLSSQSRFVRAVFTKLNSVTGDTEEEEINSFFHILYSVRMVRGCVRIGDKYEITRYSSCCNANRGIYYYTTYENSCISAVDMYAENLDSSKLIAYSLIKNQQINVQNCRKSIVKKPLTKTFLR